METPILQGVRRQSMETFYSKLRCIGVFFCVSAHKIYTLLDLTS